MEIAIVYMVAGISSRFGGKIKQFAIIKENQTLIEYSLDQALKAGFNRVYFIVGNKTEQPFKEKFGDNYKDIPITYTLQSFNEAERDKPWGTTDAIVTLKDKIDSPFVICNGDDIYGEQTFKILFNHLKEKQASATIGYKLINVLPEEGSVNRGIFKTNNNKVTDIEEVFDITNSNLKEKNLSQESLASMNIFALHPKVLDDLYEILNNFKQTHKEDRKIECLLPKELNSLIKQNKLEIDIYETPEKWFGVTNPEDEVKIRNELNKNIQQK